MRFLEYLLLLAIFGMLIYCIAQIKEFSWQLKDLVWRIQELRRLLDQMSLKERNGSSMAPGPGIVPPRTDVPPQTAAQPQPPPSPTPREVFIQTPGGTKPVPAFLLKKESEGETVAPPEQNPANTTPGAQPSPVRPAASVPQQKPFEQKSAQAPQAAFQSAQPVQPQPPKEVVVRHFPGFSQRITPASQPGAAASGPAAAPQPGRPDQTTTPGAGPSFTQKTAERSPIEARTAEVLSKMWRWFCVGEEYRPGGMSKEYAVATTWMLRAAVILLVLGLAYFIKYSHERNLLPPELRLSAAVVFALVILGIGCRLLSRKKYRVLGTSLAGTGFAGLYLCVFASVSIYHLLDTWVGLAGLAVLTAAGTALALRFDSIFLAMLAVCGGFLAPVLMDTGSRNLVGLFCYMTVLVAGSLVVARRRSWQAVNILTFLFTWGIFIASKPFPHSTGPHTYIEPLTMSPQWAAIGDKVNHSYLIAIAFGTVFFLAFCVQTVAFNLFSRRKVSLLELGFAALNGIVFMSVALPPTIAIYGREYAAILTFAGALVYLLQIQLLRTMKMEDRNLLLTLLVFGCGLIALTFPLLLKQDHLAVAWSVQAAAMLYIACRSKSVILARLSYIVYMIAAVRLLGFDLAHGYIRHVQGVWTRLMNFGSFTAALAGGFFMLKHYAAELHAAAASGGEAAATAVPGARYSLSSKIMFWCAFAVSFILIAGEFTFWKQMEVGGVVATAALYLLLLSLIPRLFRENTLGIIYAGAFLLCAYILLLFVSRPVFEANLSDFLYRFVPCLWSVALLALAGVFFGRLGLEAGSADRMAKSAHSTGIFFIVSAMAFWFLYSTDELRFLVGHYSGSRGGAHIAVSLLWGFYALVLLAFGILRGKKVVRIAALVLFAVTVLKIFFYDLAGTPALYRIAGCMVTGAALVVGAWMYARFEQKGDNPDEPRS